MRSRPQPVLVDPALLGAGPVDVYAALGALCPPGGVAVVAAAAARVDDDVLVGEIVDDGPM